MRKPLIAGNWKMNKTISEAVSLVNTIKAGVHTISGVDILVCPPFTLLSSVNEVLDRSNIELGAQNMFYASEGAYTGEISPLMLKDVGCRYVILGHSERRSIFNETDEIVNKKVKTALSYNLISILCIGETLSEREEGKAKSVVRTQLQSSLEGVDGGDITNVIIAYEPVWAIGTGKTATPEQAEEVHAFIRSELAEFYGKQAAESIRILYGGSVKPENVTDLMKQPNIDGGLIGGASLKAESFIQLVQKSAELLK